MKNELKTKRRRDADLSRFVQDFVELELKMLETPSDLDKAKNHVNQMWLGNGTKNPDTFPVIYRMMTLLYPDKKPTMGELRRAVSLPPSSATRLMDLLIQDGICRRLDDKHDRRIVRIALTNAGRRNIRAIGRAAARRSKEILSVLTTEEKIAFVSLFSKVATSLRKDKQIPSQVETQEEINVQTG